MMKKLNRKCMQRIPTDDMLLYGLSVCFARHVCLATCVWSLVEQVFWNSVYCPKHFTYYVSIGSCHNSRARNFYCRTPV